MTMTSRREGAPGGAAGGADQLQETAAQVAGRAGETAERQLSTGMTRTGESLDRLAEAVRHAGDDLRADQPQVADYADIAADQVHRAAVFLREKHASDLLEELDRFARQQPALVIGGAFALGFLATRFLKTSAPDVGSDRSGRATTGADRTGWPRAGSPASGVGAGRSGAYRSPAPGSPAYGSTRYPAPEGYGARSSGAMTPGANGGIGGDVAGAALTQRGSDNGSAGDIADSATRSEMGRDAGA